MSRVEGISDCETPNKDMPHMQSFDLVRSSDALMLMYLEGHERMTLSHYYDGMFICTGTTISRTCGPIDLLYQVDFSRREEYTLGGLSEGSLSH